MHKEPWWYCEVNIKMGSQEEMLRLLGCIVKGKLGDTAEDYSACGTLLLPREGYIISHGSILAELCLKNKSLCTKVSNGELLSEADIQGSEFHALMDSRWKSRHSGIHPMPTARESFEANHDLVRSENNSLPSVHFTPVKCKFLSAFRNDAFHKTVNRLMPDSNWTFNASSYEGTILENNSVSKQETAEMDENSVVFNLLSYFILLKVQPLYLQIDEYTSSSQHLQKSLETLKFPLLRKSTCNIGDPAEIIATPFGSQNPHVFFNTYSRGVVCNVSGPRGCWILSDARCIPGSEGGPLFTMADKRSKYLTGIIAASLCWKNKEWIGFSLACSLDSVLNALGMQLNLNNAKSKLDTKWNQVKPLEDLGARILEIEKSSKDRQRQILSSTVLVRVGSTWGSGVIIDKDQGVLLTCSHVIKDSKDFPVRIKPFQGSKEHTASVIYHHRSSLSRPFDIAILKCPEATAHLPQRRVPKLCIPQLGDKVWAVGHALFSSDLDLQPSACAGVVSKVLWYKGHPVMIQSTCAVHAGASGGPLLSEHGDLVGILVCNTVDKGSQSCFPHINMSVPAVSIWSAMQNYIKRGDTSGFAEFELSDPTVKKLWALDNSVFDGTGTLSKSKL